MEIASNVIRIHGSSTTEFPHAYRLCETIDQENANLRTNVREESTGPTSKCRRHDRGKNSGAFNSSSPKICRPKKGRIRTIHQETSESQQARPDVERPSHASSTYTRNVAPINATLQR